eukprot:1106999_1
MAMCSNVMCDQRIEFTYLSVKRSKERSARMHWSQMVVDFTSIAIVYLVQTMKLLWKPQSQKILLLKSPSTHTAENDKKKKKKRTQLTKEGTKKVQFKYGDMQFANTSVAINDMLRGGARFIQIKIMG